MIDFDRAVDLRSDTDHRPFNTHATPRPAPRIGVLAYREKESARCLFLGTGRSSYSVSTATSYGSGHSVIRPAIWR